jgi:hypothetical protein
MLHIRDQKLQQERFSKLSTLNVGAMAARLGLDPSEFLDKMKNVEGFTSGLNQRMSAEMKRTSREGAESFRLIDEALGLHVSRPLTKILTQQFPAFASALQSLVGAGVVGALGAVAFEFGEHIAKKMEEAKKREEEYADAVRKTTSVIADARAESEQRLNETLGKDAGVRGDRGVEAYYKGLATDAANVERMAKFTDQLTEALRREVTALAALEPHMSVIAKFWHELWNDSSTLGIEKINEQVKQFQDKFADLSRQDALKHTTTAADYLNAQLAAAKKKLDEMPGATKNVMMSIAPGAAIAAKAPLYSPEEIATQKLVLDRMNQIKDQQKADVTNAAADKQLERDTEAKHADEELTKAIDKIRAAQARMLEESNRFGMELHQALDKTDEIDALDAAFKKTLATLAQYRAMVGGTAFFKEFGVSADQLAQQLAQVTGQLESQAQLKRFLESTRETKGDIAPAFPIATQARAMPTLAQGGAVAGELAAFAEEPRQQIEMMKKAFAEALTPVEKFTIAQKELDSILRNVDGTFKAGAEGAAAYAGAMRHLTEEEEKAQAASRKAADGLHAFYLELQHGGDQNGQFTFNLLNTAFKDVEDGIAKTILATRNEHEQLKRMWEGYFKSLEEMALKFAMTKSLSSLVNLIPGVGGAGSGTGAGSGAGGAGAAAGGFAGFLTQLFGAFGIGAAAAGNAGNAMFDAAGGGGGILGGGAPIASAALPDSIPFMAEGGDAAPGSSFISGEAGAEEVNLDSRGGAHVTPLGMKSGGDTNHYYDMRNSVVTDDLLRKADAARMMHATSEQSVARAVSMSTEIAKRSRPTR